jgi:type VI secretion system protein ImpJ
MSDDAVHWEEGMFLRPHHFQAAQRYSLEQSQRGDKWDLHYNWGLRDLDLDLDALANNRLVVRALKARLRDGTLVAVPEEGDLPKLDLNNAFERNEPLRVYLAVPMHSLKKANVPANSTVEGARYLLDTKPLEDENTGLNPQPIRVRKLNLQLLLSTQKHDGYEVLPIAQLLKSSAASPTPQLDVNYIPPLLACDAWKPLQADILENILYRLGTKLDFLAKQVVERRINFDSQSQRDPLIFNQLRVVNEAHALLGVLIFAQGVHPLPAYLELCRVVGQLAIFGPERRPPELPRYNHDDLGRCFYDVKKYIDMLLRELEEPGYMEVPFEGAGLRMQVALQPAWLEATWQMFVGVQTENIGTEDCVRLLTRSGQLDMKIGSSDRADEIFRLGERGLIFSHSLYPPRVLPQTRGLIYFQVNRESQQQEWARVQKSLAMAIRLNENLILGSIEKQRTLRIRHGGQTIPMNFTLYVVPQAKGEEGSPSG